MQSWRRFFRLSVGERRVVLAASAALVASRIALRVTGFRAWQAVLQIKLSGKPLQSSGKAVDKNLVDLLSCQQQTLREIVRLEASASRHLFFRANCLERSLVLWWLLARRGVPAELRIGARNQAGSFEAHAWVESEGAVLNDPDGTHLHFVPFGAIPSMEAQPR
jgi:Transglutaminase-like superfamily